MGFSTFKVAGGAQDTCEEAEWLVQKKRREVAPFASVVARVGERERWIARMQRGIDWMCDSFALRPPPVRGGRPLPCTGLRACVALTLDPFRS